jgi:predicted phosphoribosyltransferase
MTSSPPVTPRYKDRPSAGRELARMVAAYEGRPGLVVLALPRGGVPVGYEVALALRAPLDVFVVRKLGAPGHEELALGAVASGGVRVINQEVVDLLGIPSVTVEAISLRERLELARSEEIYRGRRRPMPIQGRTVMLVDDGLATGSSMRAAVLGRRQQSPARSVVAVPIASVAACDEFRREVDEIFCGLTPEPFRAVGLWYASFPPVSDLEVAELLQRASERGIDPA